MITEGDYAGDAESVWTIAYRDGRDLARVITRVAGQAPILVSDLFLGSWRAHWIARELAAQLDIDLPMQRRPTPGGPERQEACDSVACLIDLETAGDTIILAAHAAAAAIAVAARKALIRLVLVLAPEHGAWAPEDLWLIRFLARQLDQAHVAIVIAHRENALDMPSLSTRRLAQPYESSSAAIFYRHADPGRPGLVPKEGMGDPYPCLAAFGGWALFCPENRKQRTFADRKSPVWLQAFKEAASPANRRDIATLWRGAAQCFADGGTLQAVRLIDAAQEATNDPVMRASLEARAQAMRIAALDFQAAAARPDPPPDLPEAFVRELSASKAWGLTMMRRAGEAELLFEKARALDDRPSDDPLRLYLLNISALNQLRLGRHEQAFIFEREIEAELSKRRVPDWHLGYINALNLARLYRLDGQYDKSKRYFLNAFSINKGLRSDSDQVYLNLCQATVEAAEHHWAPALLARLRAALHWLAMPVPEALAPRVAQALSVDRNERMAARFSAAMRDALAVLLDRLGPPFCDVTSRPASGPPLFRRPRSTPAQAMTAAGGPGWGVLLCDHDRCEGTIRPEHQALAALVAGILALLAEGMRFDGTKTVIVDDGFGVEMPTTAHELLGLAWRHGCETLQFGRARCSLTPAELVSCDSRCRIMIGPGISGLGRYDGKTVATFRRSRDPLPLSAEDSRLVELARNEPLAVSAAEQLGLSLTAVITAARRLEALRVLSLQPPAPPR